MNAPILPTYPADASAILQAALNAINPDRGGDLCITQGRYRLAKGLTSIIQGLVLKGEGMPGMNQADCRGSTQLVTDDGVVGITLGITASHQTRGYGLKRIHVYSGATGLGTGVVILNAEQSHEQNSNAVA